MINTIQSKWISLKLTRSDDWSFEEIDDDHVLITTPNNPFKVLAHFGPSIVIWRWIDGDIPVEDPEALLTDGDTVFEADYRAELADYAKSIVFLLRAYEGRV